MTTPDVLQWPVTHDSDSGLQPELAAALNIDPQAAGRALAIISGYQPQTPGVVVQFRSRDTLLDVRAFDSAQDPDNTLRLQVPVTGSTVQELIAKRDAINRAAIYGLHQVVNISKGRKSVVESDDIRGVKPEDSLLFLGLGVVTMGTALAKGVLAHGKNKRADYSQTRDIVTTFGTAGAYLALGGTVGRMLWKKTRNNTDNRLWRRDRAETANRQNLIRALEATAELGPIVTVEKPIQD